MSKFVYLIFSLLILSGCGGAKKQVETDLKFSVGAVVNGTPMDGGIHMWGYRYNEDGVLQEFLDLDLPETHVVVLTTGIWDLHFVGYTGPTAWAGTTYCGGTVGASLLEENSSLAIDISTAECANLPYTDMIASKSSSAVGEWDTSNWDEVNWAP